MPFYDFQPIPVGPIDLNTGKEDLATAFRLANTQKQRQQQGGGGGGLSGLFGGGGFSGDLFGGNNNQAVIDAALLRALKRAPDSTTTPSIGNDGLMA